MEHEVIREAGEIALDRLIQRAGLDPVKRSEIEIQYHLFMANPVDLRSNGRRGNGKGVLWHGVKPHTSAIAVGSPSPQRKQRLKAEG